MVYSRDSSRHIGRRSSDHISDLSRSICCQTDRRTALMLFLSKALSTLATIVAEFGGYSRQCGQGLTSHIGRSYYFTTAQCSRCISIYWVAGGPIQKCASPVASQMQCQMVALCNVCAHHSSLPGIFWCWYWIWLCFNDQCIQSVLEGQL